MMQGAGVLSVTHESSRSACNNCVLDGKAVTNEKGSTLVRSMCNRPIRRGVKLWLVVYKKRHMQFDSIFLPNI